MATDPDCTHPDCDCEDVCEYAPPRRRMKLVTCTHGKPIGSGCRDCTAEFQRDQRRQRAFQVLEHYIRTAWMAAGLEWTPDNAGELAALVEDLIP